MHRRQNGQLLSNKHRLLYSLLKSVTRLAQTLARQDDDDMNSAEEQAVEEVTAADRSKRKLDEEFTHQVKCKRRRFADLAWFAYWAFST